MQRSLIARLRQLSDRLGRRMSAPTLKIGVSARILHPQPGARGLQSKTLQYLEQTAAHWLMSRNVLVLMVPSVDTGGLVHRSEIRLSDYARHLDGLMLQGGADVSPLTYGEEPLKRDWSGDRMRDEYEIELLHEFIEAGKPVLGICRGAQLINVAYGGTLYQDIAQQVPAARRFEVAGRLDHTGKVIRPLDEAAIEDVVERVAASGAKAVAVSLLHAYANPEHEELLAARLRRRLPYVALSSRVNPEAREYERTSTTVLSASVMPLAAGYLDRLERLKPDRSRLHLFHSAGGMASPAALRELPLSLAISGPAAGVAAASHVARMNLQTGQWSALSSGINGMVNALVYSDGVLYAGGAFKSAGNATAEDVA